MYWSDDDLSRGRSCKPPACCKMSVFVLCFCSHCALVYESLPLKMFVLPAFIKRQNAVQSIHMVPHPHKEHKQKRQGKSR